MGQTKRARRHHASAFSLPIAPVSDPRGASTASLPSHAHSSALVPRSPTKNVSRTTDNTAPFARTLRTVTTKQNAPERPNQRAKKKIETTVTNGGATKHPKPRLLQREYGARTSDRQAPFRSTATTKRETHDDKRNKNELAATHTRTHAQTPSHRQRHTDQYGRRRKRS